MFASHVAIHGAMLCHTSVTITQSEKTTTPLTKNARALWQRHQNEMSIPVVPCFSFRDISFCGFVSKSLTPFELLVVGKVAYQTYCPQTRTLGFGNRCMK